MSEIGYQHTWLEIYVLLYSFCPNSDRKYQNCRSLVINTHDRRYMVYSKDFDQIQKGKPKNVGAWLSTHMIWTNYLEIYGLFYYFLPNSDRKAQKCWSLVFNTQGQRYMIYSIVFAQILIGKRKNYGAWL